MSAACFASAGHRVVSIDKNAQKIANLHQGLIPIYEPGLGDMVQAQIKSGRLEFSVEMEPVNSADVVFMAVGTPSLADGNPDLSQVYNAAASVAPHLKNGAVVVGKSTIPVGTNRQIQEIIASLVPNLDFSIASNPEFLREGSAVQDFLEPDRILIGTEDERAKNAMAKVYAPIANGCMANAPMVNPRIVFTDIATAELTKYAANCFLATKVSFINEVADICEKVGANIEDLSEALGLDSRIGQKFLKPGPGFGGSCFPKDAYALIKVAREVKAPSTIVESAIEANENRKIRMADKISSHLSAGESVAIFGLTFKANTDDVRESPSITIINQLLSYGLHVQTHDPKGIEQAQQVFGNRIKYFDSPYDAAAGASAVAILTEWKEYENLDLLLLKNQMLGTYFYDLRNLLNPSAVSAAGFDYYAVGKGEFKKELVD